MVTADSDADAKELSPMLFTEVGMARNWRGRNSKAPLPI
jgi:hypothetical protein